MVQSHECFLRYTRRNCGHRPCSNRCPPRFLRATKWHFSDCIKKLEAALKWRREYGIYDTLTLESIKEHVRVTV